MVANFQRLVIRVLFYFLQHLKFVAVTKFINSFCPYRANI